MLVAAGLAGHRTTVGESAQQLHMPRPQRETHQNLNNSVNLEAGLANNAACDWTTLTGTTTV